MDILKLSKLKVAAYVAGGLAVAAAVYKVSIVGKDQFDIILNKVFDRNNISVENISAETVDSDVINLWNDDDDFDDDFQED